MKDFLKQVLAVLVGFGIISLFGFVMLLSVIAAAMAGDSPETEVKKESVLQISLDGVIADRVVDNPLNMLWNERGQAQSLDDLLLAVKEARTNDKIKAIFIHAGLVDAPLANLQELREALSNFKKSGKKIYAYGDDYSQGAYYVSSVADKLMLNPAGLIDWHGLSVQPVYYKDLLDKVGVSMQLIRVGKYKSAGEVYIQNSMSDANREQLSTMLGTMWREVTAKVAVDRKRSVEQLNALADNYVAFGQTEDFVKSGLADTLCYIDGAKSKLKELLGTDELRMVSPKALVSQISSKSAEKKVAVYYAAGPIVDERIPNLNSDESISASTMVPDLEDLEDDDDVSAVVIRVNSPGGSASASEKIWHAIKKLNTKKPVIISMGGVAASGGYYIACGGRTIFADPTTITGSIGIYASIPEASGLLTAKLGLRFETVKTNASADFLTSYSRPLTEGETQVLQAYINRGYDLFLKRVAENRKMTTEQVHQWAQGRVWSGYDAKQIGLVDKLGGLDNAVTFAAKTAKLGDYEVVAYPKPKEWFEDFINQTKNNYFDSQMREVLGDLYTPFMYARSLKGQNSIQTALPYELKVK